MRAFAAAKLAASRKGVRTTQVTTRDPNPFLQILRRPIVIGPLLILAAILFYMSLPAKPPAWTRLPATPSDSATQFLKDISTGQDAGYDAAYAMISKSVHDPDLDDEIGHYRQVFHVMYLYLSGEFGNNWGSTISVEPDKVDPDRIIAHCGLETLHLQLVEETPPDKLNDSNHHFAIKYIEEFDVHDSDKYLQMAGIKGVLRGEAGQGAVNNLDSVLGAMGGSGHETKMQTKIRLLPKMHNPHSINKFEVFQTWPVRKDPVVINRLQAIVNDGRFDQDIQDAAKRVLDGTVTEEELIAAHASDE
jgi:hypothetical protein